MINRGDDNSPFIIRAASHAWDIPAQIYAYTSLYYDYSNDHHDFATCCLIKLFFSRWRFVRVCKWQQDTLFLFGVRQRNVYTCLGIEANINLFSGFHTNTNLILDTRMELSLAPNYTLGLRCAVTTEHEHIFLPYTLKLLT